MSMRTFLPGDVSVLITLEFQDAIRNASNANVSFESSFETKVQIIKQLNWDINKHKSSEKYYIRLYHDFLLNAINYCSYRLY